MGDLSCIPMPTIRPRFLLHKEITYDEANESETNILHPLGYPEERSKFYYHIYEHGNLIQRRVAHHLDLFSASVCRIESPKQWRQGTVNFCVQSQEIAPIIQRMHIFNDLLLGHDNRLRHQPNAVKSISYCATQMSALSLMRTLRSGFFDQTCNRGPVIVCLTDMHHSNILVDDDWDVKYIIDLDWAAVPPPYLYAASIL